MKTMKQKAYEDIVKIVRNARPSELTKQVQINLSKYGHQHEWVEFEVKLDVENKPEYCWCAIRRGSMGQWIHPTKGNYVTYFKTIKGCINNYINTYLDSVHCLSEDLMDDGVKKMYSPKTSGITTNDLAKLIQTELDKHNWKKVHDHSTFHAILKDVTTKVLVDNKCEYNLHYSTWHIAIDHRHMGVDFEDSKVINFDRDFQKYKNVRYGDRGNFSNVRALVNIDFHDVAIKNVVPYAQELSRQRYIKRTEEHIADLEEKLTSAKQRLANLNGTIYDSLVRAESVVDRSAGETIEEIHGGEFMRYRIVKS